MDTLVDSFFIRYNKRRKLENTETRVKFYLIAKCRFHITFQPM